MFFSSVEKLKPAMRLFVALGKFAAGPSFLGGLSTAASLHDHASALARERPAALERLADTLADDAVKHFEVRRDLPQDAEILFTDMVQAARITPEALLAANLRPAAIVDALLESLTNVEHRLPAMQALFRRVTEPSFARLLVDPAISAEVLPHVMSEILTRQADYAKTIEALQGEVKTLSAGLRDVVDTRGAPNDLDRARLEALANRFEVPRPHVLSTEELFQILSAKAADLAKYEASLGTLAGSDALEALREEAKTALDALDFAAAQAIFAEAHRARLGAAAETGELMARNALVFNHVEEAYRHFGAISDSFRAVDPEEALRRRGGYAAELSDHGARYASNGMEYAVELLKPALDLPEITDFPLLKAKLYCQVADAVSECLAADPGPLWEQNFKKTVEFYVAADAILQTEVDDPLTRAGVQNNLANLAALAAKIGPGVDRSLMWTNAIDGYQAALDIYDAEGEKLLWAQALGNLALVFAESAEGMKLEEQKLWLRKSISFLQEALAVYSEAGMLEEQALAMHNLSNQRAVLSGLVDTEEAEELLSLAERGFALISNIFAEMRHPMHLVRAFLSHAEVFARVGLLRGGGEGAQFLEAALTLARKAEDVITPGSQPVMWAMMYRDRGRWQEALAGLDANNAAAHLTEAAKAYRVARNIYEPEHASDLYGSYEAMARAAETRRDDLTT